MNLSNRNENRSKTERSEQPRLPPAWRRLAEQLGKLVAQAILEVREAKGPIKSGRR